MSFPFVGQHAHVVRTFDIRTFDVHTFDVHTFDVHTFDVRTADRTTQVQPTVPRGERRPVGAVVVATLVILLVLAACCYWANKIVCRRDARTPTEQHHPARSAAPTDLRLPPAEAMVWTAVDDRQFRRLVDGMSPEHGG